MLAQKTYDRISELTEHGHASVAQLDQATDSLAESQRAADQAKSAYDEAVNGHTKEEREIAEATVKKSDSLTAAVRHAAARTAPKAATVGSLVAETIVLVNPARNYAQFLLRALLPMVLHVVIAISAGYAVGSEFRRRSMRVWLACAGDNPIVALAGKLAPLFGIFFVFMCSSMPLLLEGLLGISFKGDVLMMVISGALLIVGYLALGALLQLVVCDLAVGLGLTGLVVSPAFGYAGIGFPTFGMNTFAQLWSTALPLRWYMAVLLGQAARGLPVAD